MIMRSEYYINAARKLTFKDEMIDYIYAEHLIEHLTKEELVNFLAECYRVLNRNGMIRLSTPDFELLIKIYLDTNLAVDLDTAMKRHKEKFYSGKSGSDLKKADYLNNKIRMWGGHKYIYDYELLKYLLEKANFGEIEKWQARESNCQELANLEEHADAEWMDQAEQLIVEARKDFA